MVSVPVRAAPVFAAALKTTAPLPVPEAPLAIVSHGAFAPAVHAQEAADAVTAIDPVPPASPTLWVVGPMENVQGGGGGAACDTVNVCPAIVRVPLRAAPVFAAMPKATV